MRRTKITSPAVARRLNGMGGQGYITKIDDQEEYWANVGVMRRFGLDFDQLVAAGKVWVMFDGERQETRRIVQREIERQKKIAGK